MNVQRKLMLAQLSHHVSILLVHTAVIVRLVGEIDAHTCIDVDECLVGSHSCPSNSRCSNTPGFYRCICLAGWRNQGPSTCVDIDECSVGSHNCPSNSRCSNTIGSYLCRCKSGFTQPYSRSRCQDINECTTGSHSCSSYGNAYCVNTIGSYYCRCNRCYYMSGRSCNRK